MKTINVPLIGSCPRWVDDISPARLAEYKALLAQVHRDVLNLAGRAVVGAEDPCQWHLKLFAPFVPLPYYAGHYRGVDHNRPCLAQQVAVGATSIGAVPGADYRQVRNFLDNLLNQVRGQLTQLEMRWPELSPRDRAFQLAVVTANLVGGFIQIHPFLNGNGRVSRLLWRWCLLRFGVPPQVCTHPRPDPPYSSIMDSAMRGDYRPAVLYVLQHLSLHKPVQNSAARN